MNKGKSYIKSKSIERLLDVLNQISLAQGKFTVKELNNMTNIDPNWLFEAERLGYVTRDDKRFLFTKYTEFEPIMARNIITTFNQKRQKKKEEKRKADQLMKDVVQFASSKGLIKEKPVTEMKEEKARIITIPENRGVFPNIVPDKIGGLFQHLDQESPSVKTSVIPENAKTMKEIPKGLFEDKAIDYHSLGKSFENASLKTFPQRNNKPFKNEVETNTKVVTLFGINILKIVRKRIITRE